MNKWFQDSTEKYPELLPVFEIEPAFTPLVLAGYELPVISGYIDNFIPKSTGLLSHR